MLLAVRCGAVAVEDYAKKLAETENMHTGEIIISRSAPAAAAAATTSLPTRAFTEDRKT